MAETRDARDASDARGPGDADGAPIVNFGGNVSFTPRYRYAPHSEAEVLEILDRHAGGTIRVIASLHSWSDDMVSDDVVIDLRHFDQVAVDTCDGEIWATVGAGCVLSEALARIRADADATFPTIGAVTVQRMAGVVSTATHGSGRSSFSHYMAALRVAAYDPETGAARIFEFATGDELRAARCAIGAMGVILTVRFRCVPAYLVAETLEECATLDEVLAGEAACPLQQFVLVPYRWSYIVFRRREAGSERRGRPSWWRLVHRAYAFFGVDVLLHLIIKALVTIGRSDWIRGFFRSVFVHLAWRNRTVIDRSERILTLHHELFKHLELELFVPGHRLAEALAIVRHAVAVFDGSEAAPEAATWAASGAASRAAIEAALAGVGMLDELRNRAGSYTHHYPIFVRRVLPDDALIAMTAGADEPFYTISLFCYHEPRTAFYGLADFVARALNRLHGACPHWGKYFPLDYGELDAHYPGLAAFRAICRRHDPRGTFRNRYVTSVLGFDRDDDAPQNRIGQPAPRDAHADALRMHP